MNARKLIVKMIENWPVKALSIALAVVLFVFHQLNTMTTRRLSVPLTIETNSALVPASSYPRNVRVSLRGEDDNIKLIAESDIEAYVDFTRYDEGGLHNASIQIRRKGTALSIEPLEITVSPSKISVQLDRRISKTVPLTAVIRGRAADGFDLVSYSISPLEITVTGPLSFLESIEEIETEIIDLDGRNNDFTIEVNISPVGPYLSLRGSGTAEFSCVIRPSVSVRSIEGIPIIPVGLAPEFEADMGGKTGSVRIEGNQSQLDGFQPPANFLAVDCSDLFEPGVYTLPVVIDLPRDLSLIRREPEDINLIITLKELF